jgi:hypothetical protein
VKVRKAIGRSVASGSSIGSTVDFGGGFSAGGARIGAVLRGLMGWTGVPNAGDDEGMTFAGTAEGFSGRLAVAIVSIEIGVSKSCRACVDALYGASRGEIAVVQARDSSLLS